MPPAQVLDYELMPQMTDDVSARKSSSSGGKQSFRTWQPKERNRIFKHVQIYSGRESTHSLRPFISFPTHNTEVFKNAWNAVAAIEAECKNKNWDGYGAKAISQNAINDMRLLLRLLPSNLVEPDIVAEPSGSIGLEWRKGEMMLILSVAGDGFITFAVLLDDEDNIHGTNRFSNVIPRFIQASIFPIFSN